MGSWISVGLLVLIPAFWCFISILLAHIGAWSALADHYRATEPPQGKVFRMQSGRMGLVNYDSCLTIHVSNAGMFVAVFPLFRVGHPPLFIPWSEFDDFREKKTMFWRFIEAPIGTPPIAILLLQPGITPVKLLETRSPPSPSSC